DAFERVIGNLPAGSGAPDTYMRAAEAYAIYLADKGERDKALNAIERSEELVKGRITTEALRERIEAGREVKPSVSTPADGAAGTAKRARSSLAPSRSSRVSPIRRSNSTGAVRPTPRSSGSSSCSSA